MPSGTPSTVAERQDGQLHDRMLDERQAAEVLGLSVRTLRRWRWAGHGVTWHKIGNAVRYKAVDIAAFIEAGRRETHTHAA